MQKGQIRVQTENIFPIIKKFLYSEHEIFLRELVSNAVDASQKLTTLLSLGEAKGEAGDLRIDVQLDAAAKTLTITDRGVGMSAEEVDKYINQVAFSGAEEFMQKYKDANIIGHFGLGFYSAFMVSDKVEIFSKSHTGAPGVYWSCDGSPEFELYEVDYDQRGTKIVLHINEESKEFLEAGRIKGILERFCKFLPVSIYFSEAGQEKPEEEKSINNTRPLWVQKPADLTKEDYEKFYRELYPFNETPLFWIHLNVDYPFNLTGILYFPKIKHSYEIQKDKIQLYCNQVFVTDEVANIVPEFLMLLQGVIDSPDIPLNVSRSYLQGDPNVKKINSHITKKVADKLDEIFRNERSSLEEKWESLGLFVKYGMMTDDKFMEKANKFLVMEDTDGKFHTLEEYTNATSALQKNKDGKQVILYTTNPVQQDAYISACKNKGYVVLKMETIVDAAFINTMESKWENVSFVRVDADIVDNLIDKQEKEESVLTKEETEQLKELFKLDIPELHVTTEVKGLSVDSDPVIATRPEFMRRMKDMGAAGGGMTAFYAQMPDEVTLTVNGNHPIFGSLLKETDESLKKDRVRNLADLALLSQGLLKGNDLTAFIQRSVRMMQS
ncbi:MAG: molecular chaperone HtpG [Chitinophagaceae bacterium]|nr:molecular chaperone HtpG [Chitinophagaceae bacterium]MCA6478439.1 molecular chaperone HtpG [Chitinophagaceae bacterium]